MGKRAGATGQTRKENAMFDLGGTFEGFVASLLSFLSGFLSALFSGLTGVFDGLNVF